MDFDHLAQYFAARGLKAVFGIPGSGSSLSLLDAMEKQGIAFHLTKFEGSAVLMAAAMGRLSGKAGLSLSIKGPGLANSVPGLAAAWFEAFPVVHLTEAAARNAPPSAAHKRLNHEALVSAVSKGISTLTGNENPDKAFTLAEAEEPGPVVLELQESSGDYHSADDPVMIRDDAAHVPDLIRRCKRPVVIAGALAARMGWESRLNSLNIPVFSTAAAKGVVDETRPHSAGVYTGVGGEMTPEFQLLPKADLVLCLGLTAREVLAARPFACESVSVSAVQTPGHDGFAFSHSTRVDSLEDILVSLSGKSWGLDELSSIREALRSYMTKDFLPGRVFENIYQHFSGQVRGVLDTGYFCTIGEHAWPAQKADLCLMSGQGRYMGTGLPMALGASLYDQAMPTIAFLGDGSVGMYTSEAALAARLKLPLLTVHMSDRAFGSIRTRAIKDGLTQIPLTMDGRSWTGMFEAMGIPGTRAQNIKEVSRAVSSWDPESGPAFLEIIFDPDKYEAMVRGIR
jgi:acetolactate synthase I/II/III large subunit